MKCPYCGGGHIVKKGFSYTKYKPAQQRFVCKGCDKNFGDSFKGENYVEEMPKILLLDIETSLYHVATWGISNTSSTIRSLNINIFYPGLPSGYLMIRCLVILLLPMNQLIGTING